MSEVALTMLAPDLRNLHEEGEQLHPCMMAVVRRCESCGFDDPVDPAEVSSVLRQLAEDEALIRRGLELAEDLTFYFRAAARDSNICDAAQLNAFADLWAARITVYVRWGAWTVCRAKRVAHRAKLAADAAAKQAAEERFRAERLLAVRAAVERALLERAEAVRDLHRREAKIVTSQAVQELDELVVLREAQELIALPQAQANIETHEALEFVAATLVSQKLVTVEEAQALPALTEELAAPMVAAGSAMEALLTRRRLAWAEIYGNNAVHGIGGGVPSRWAHRCVGRTRSMAARGAVELRGRLPRSEHGGRDATMSGPGPPRGDGPSKEPVRAG